VNVFWEVMLYLWTALTVPMLLKVSKLYLYLWNGWTKWILANGEEKKHCNVIVLLNV